MHFRTPHKRVSFCLFVVSSGTRFVHISKQYIRSAKYRSVLVSEKYSGTRAALKCFANRVNSGFNWSARVPESTGASSPHVLLDHYYYDPWRGGGGGWMLYGACLISRVPFWRDRDRRNNIVRAGILLDTSPATAKTTNITGIGRVESRRWLDARATITAGWKTYWTPENGCFFFSNGWSGERKNVYNNKLKRRGTWRRTFVSCCGSRLSFHTRARVPVSRQPIGMLNVPDLARSSVFCAPDSRHGRRDENENNNE